MSSAEEFVFHPSSMDTLFMNICVFLPSAAASRATTPLSWLSVSALTKRLVSLTVCAVLLAIKLRHAALPWALVLLPLLVSDALSLYFDGTALRRAWKERESVQYERVRAVDTLSNEELGNAAAHIPQYAQETSVSHAASEREIERERDIASRVASLLDTLSTFYAAFLAIICLSAQALPLSLSAALLPTWLCVALSLALRVNREYSLNASLRALSLDRSRYRTLWAAPLALAVRLSLRLLQPLLIALRIENALSAPWSVVLTPLWIVAFLSLSVALLLVSFIPYMQSSQSSLAAMALKRSGNTLGYTLALQVGVCAALLCWLILSASTLLDSWFAEEETQQGGSAAGVMAPLLLLLVALLVSMPVVRKLALLFQAELASQAVESFSSQPSNSLTTNNDKIASIETVNKIQWLLQTSSSTFVVADRKSLSESALSTNVHVVDPSTTSSSAKTNNVLDWISSPMSSMFAAQQAFTEKQSAMKSPAGRESKSSSSSSSTDIEMSSLSPPARPTSVESVPTTQMTTYCVVCLSRPVDSVIQDCGHCACCVSCVLSIAKQYPGHCPVCRATITTVVHLKDKPITMADGKTVAVSNVSYAVMDPAKRRHGGDATAHELARQAAVTRTLELLADHESVVDIFL